MEQIKAMWEGLDTRRRVALAVGVVLAIVAIAAMSRLASRPTMSLLYAGLDGPAAGEVMTALDQRNVAYDVRGEAIYVPSASRDSLRLALAGEGLPDNGTRGYELLDDLSGFGTTSQMFDAAYWRAKEGELARTILANPQISHARVHISNISNSAFGASHDPTASVSISHAGVPITPAQANAIRFLVASAVAGLPPENVTVIDANGSLLSAQEGDSAGGASETRSQMLRERVLRMLEARVGAGNAVVEVSVETVTETESIRERRFDPEGRVAISSDIEERTDSSSGSGGEVTVASNLPDGDAADAEHNRSNANSTRERVNYEVSESEREILKAPGDIRRLTVAVLVNGLQVLNDEGRSVIQPRPEEELDALKELVASAVGLNEARGDVITIKSMAFPDVAELGSGPTSGRFRDMSLDLTSVLQILVLGVVSILMAVLVLRPLLRSNAEGPALALESPDRMPFEPLDTVTGDLDLSGEAGLMPLPLGGPEGEGDSWSAPALPFSDEDNLDRLKDLIGDRQVEAVEILRDWLEESREEA